MPAEWPLPPESFAPAPGEVLILLASLEIPPERLASLRATFSPREQARADSFAHDHLRRHWSAARGMLREILGRATGLPPQQIDFTYGAHGKPALRQDPSLRFNVSHSGERALYAFSRTGEVGVDIELPRGRRTDDLARRFFAPGEQQRLFALEQPARADAFFRLWTCKEAFMKATGEGLSRSLRSYEIDPAQGRVLWATGEDAARWSVHPLDPPGPYLAALIAEGPAAVRRHRYPAS